MNCIRLLLFFKGFYGTLQLEIEQKLGTYISVYFIYLQKIMNFSFELNGSAMSGNITPEAMMWASTVFWAALGWLAMVRMIIILGLGTLMIISRWRIFKKAGLPGRGILIPVYNRALLFKLWGMSGRWALSILFPPLFIVMMIINIFNITNKFWKHWTFGLGMIFIKIVFVPILAFDNSKYLGKKSIKKIIRIVPTQEVKTQSKSTIKKPVAKKIVKKTPAKAVTKKAPAKKVKTFIKKK